MMLYCANKIGGWMKSAALNAGAKAGARNFESAVQMLGETTLKKPFIVAFISQPENLKNLEKYKQINAKLADPRLIKSNQKLADDLIKQGKTVDFSRKVVMFFTQ